MCIILYTNIKFNNMNSCEYLCSICDCISCSEYKYNEDKYIKNKYEYCFVNFDDGIYKNKIFYYDNKPDKLLFLCEKCITKLLNEKILRIKGLNFNGTYEQMLIDYELQSFYDKLWKRAEMKYMNPSIYIYAICNFLYMHRNNVGYIDFPAFKQYID